MSRGPILLVLTVPFRRDGDALLVEDQARNGLERWADNFGSVVIAAPTIPEHLAAKELGLHNDLQDESSIVGNFPIIPALADYGSEGQKTYIEGIITGKKHLSFALTEPGHGSDALFRCSDRNSCSGDS